MVGVEDAIMINLQDFGTDDALGGVAILADFTDPPEQHQHNRSVALALAAAGLFVFPATVSPKPNGDGWDKKPLIGGWQSKATTDLAQIERWWQQHPRALPAIEMGRSGLVALDGDRHGGPDGVMALDDALGDVPCHPVSLTAGDGVHHFFRQPPGEGPLGNGKGSLPPGVDVRGAGGWVVAPGSARPDGKAWQPDPDAPSLAEAFRSGSIPVVPHHIVEMIRAAPSRIDKVAPRPAASITERAIATIVAPAGRRELAYGERLLQGVCDEISATTEGGRNNIVNIGAYRVGRAVASGRIDPGAAERALLSAANDNGLVADDGEIAVLATIRSGLRGGSLRPLEPLTDRPLFNVIEEPVAELVTSRLHWHHDNENEVAVPRWLVKKMLMECGVALLSAQWSAGKTFVALHLAECVARGKPFAGQRIKRQGGTLFFAAEAAGDIPIRLRGITAGPLRIKQDPLPFAWLEKVPLLSAPGALEQMKKDARDAAAVMQSRYGLPLALIVVDTMAAASGVEDENDAAQGQAVMNVLHDLARATGALVLVVDHFGKTIGSGTRGTSAKDSSADALLVLIAPQSLEGVVESRTLAVRKVRGGKTGAQYAFELEEVSFGADEDGDEITTCVVKFVEGPAVVQVKGDRWKGLKDLEEALHVALGSEDHKQMRPYGYEGPEVDAVPLRVVREEFYKAFGTAEDDPARQKEARKKALQRALKKGRENRLLATREIDGEDFVWMATVDPAAAPRSVPERASDFG
jgi:RecA-family ATPase